MPQLTIRVHAFTLSGMDSGDLSSIDADRIRKALPSVAYLSALKRRMEQRGFPPDDPLYRHVVQAQQALSDLHIHVHYMTCRGKVGDLAS